MGQSSPLNGTAHFDPALFGDPEPPASQPVPGSPRSLATQPATLLPHLPAGPRPLTGREADAVPILELQPALPELALAFLHPGLLLAQLVDDDVELPLQDVDLPLGQLLLAAPQQLLLGLLLERGPRQLLLPGAELLQGQKYGSKERVLSAGGEAEGP